MDSPPPALRFPCVTAEMPPELADALRVRGFQPAAENRSDRLADWTLHHRRGLLLLRGGSLAEEAWVSWPTPPGAIAPESVEGAPKPPAGRARRA